MITDWNVEAANIERRRKFAEALRGQAMQPLETNQMAGGYVVPVSPLQGLSKLAQAYVASKYERGAEKDATDLAARKSKALQDALSGAFSNVPAQPEQRGPFLEGLSRPAQAERPKTMTEVAQALLGNQDTMGLGGKLLIEDIVNRNKTAEPFTLSENQVRYGPDGRLIAKGPEKTDLDALVIMGQDGKAMINPIALEAKRRIAEAGRQPAAPNPITPVTIQDPDNPNATIVIDGRTREVLGKGPKLTEAGSMEKKRQFSMEGIGKVIKQAEDLLSGASGKALPTGSGIGTAYDFVAGLVGASPDGADEAQTLKSIGGALTSKMPRMEGPQSDKDTILYKEMAAVVGDSTIPRSRRLAALNVVKDIWAKYERLNPDAFEAASNAQPADQSASPAGIDRQVWDHMTPEERALWAN